MDFQKEYTSATEKEIGKKIISDDIYALCRVLLELNEMISRLSIK